ncbi:MAG TPA: cobalamin-binding protein [Negativicutes bacterium]
MGKRQQLTLGLLVLLMLVFWLTTDNFGLVGQLAHNVKPETIDTKGVFLAAKPQRIVSMSPGNTEILFALGAGDRVVGVTSFCDYPEQAKAKPKIGGFYTPDVETIVTLAPDIVFAAGDVQSRYISSLQQAGIPVVSIEPKTMPEVLAAITVISELIGEQANGAVLHAALANQLEQVHQLTKATTPRRVFLEVWDMPFLTVGSKSFISDIITQAGGISAAIDRDVDYTPCDFETLYAYDPETYITINRTQEESRTVSNRPELAEITAIKENQVYHMQDDILARPGPRSFTGLAQLAKLLHPEVMQNWREE